MGYLDEYENRPLTASGGVLAASGLRRGGSGVLAASGGAVAGASGRGAVLPVRGGHNQTRRAQEAVVALMAGKTVKQSAQDCGLGYRTLKGWLASEWFMTLYQAARQQLLTGTVDKLRTSGCTAVETLTAIAADEGAPPAARVAASRALLEIMFRAIELEDVLVRLDKLEHERSDDEIA